MKKTGFYLLFSVIWVCLISNPVNAQFAGGDGTQNDPWQVENADQLDRIRHHLNDIDVTGYNYVGGLAVYDMPGRRVAVLINERRQAGRHQADFDAAGLASGVYISRLQTGDAVRTRQMTLIK